MQEVLHYRLLTRLTGAAGVAVTATRLTRQTLLDMADNEGCESALSHWTVRRTKDLCESSLGNPHVIHLFVGLFHAAGLHSVPDT